MPSEPIQQTAHLNIALLLKQFREEAGKTQKQLAQELNEHHSLKQHNRTISQWGINRIENGNASLRPILASALDTYAVDNGLSSPGFSFLVTNLKTRQTKRPSGSKIDHILRNNDYSSVFVVICDVFDFAGSLKIALSIPELQVSVIVPTMNRITELFSGSSTDGVSRTELFDGYVERLCRHIDEQLQLMHDVCSRSRETQLDVFESNIVLNSVVLTKGDRVTRCMYWPCAPGGPTQLEPNFVPVADDGAVSAWYETQIANIIRLGSVTHQVHVGDMLVTSDDASSPDGTHASIGKPTFSRFCPRKISGDDTDKTTEGAAVALILPYVSIVRGGKQLTQVLFNWRSPLVADEVLSPNGQLSFLATRIFSPLVWQAIDDIGCEGDDRMAPEVTHNSDSEGSSSYVIYRTEDLDYQSRRALTMIGSSVKANSESFRNTEELMIGQACVSAVHRHLQLTYGVDFRRKDSTDDRIESIDLLNVSIAKPYGAYIVPRLHLVRLDVGQRDAMIRNASRYTNQEISCLITDELLAMIEREEGTSEPGRYDDCLGLVIRDARFSAEFRRLILSLGERSGSP